MCVGIFYACTYTYMHRYFSTLKLFQKQNVCTNSTVKKIINSNNCNLFLKEKKENIIEIYVHIKRIPWGQITLAGLKPIHTYMYLYVRTVCEVNSFCLESQAVGGSGCGEKSWFMTFKCHSKCIKIQATTRRRQIVKVRMRLHIYLHKYMHIHIYIHMLKRK